MSTRRRPTVAELIARSQVNRRSEKIRRALFPPLSEYDARRRSHYRQASTNRLAIAGALTDEEHRQMTVDALREDQPLIVAVWDAEEAEEAYRRRMIEEGRRRRG